MNPIRQKTRRRAQLMMKSFVFFVSLSAATLAVAAQSPGQQQGANRDRRDDKPGANPFVTILSPDERTSVDALPAQIAVRLGKRAEPRTFRAHLNGRDITSRFADEWFWNRGGVLLASVTPGDGLVRGRNRLRVTVRGPGSSGGFDSSVFQVTVKSPVADAGDDLRQKIGRAVQLDGTGSAAGGSAGTGTLTHKWTLVQRPAGSNARLDNPSSPQPSFVPDAHGTYVAQLVVNDGGFDSAPDTVEISATLSQTLVPVQTRVVNGDGSNPSDYCIMINGAAYCGDPNGNVNAGLQVAVLNRKTLEIAPGGVKTFDTSGGFAGVINFLDTQDNSKIVIIATFKAVGHSTAQLAPTLEKFGATTEFRGATDPSFTFSFIGIKGLTSGQAYQVGSGGGSVVNHVGYFAPDSQTNYAFTQTDYVVFEITPSKDVNTPSTIKVGDNQTFASAAAPGALGGFLLAVVDRATLQLVKSDTYHTYTTTDSSDEEERLTNDLRSYVGDESVLVFLTTYGSPHDGYTQHFAKIAQAITDLGGTYEAAYDLNVGDTYSLVSVANSPVVSPHQPMALDARESGSKITPNQTSGSLRGVLGRGRRGNWYRPLTADLSGLANLDFYRIIAKAPTPFPAFSADEQAAYTFISQNLTGGPDFRTAYTDSNKDLDNLNFQLGNLADAGGEKCTTTVDRCVTTAVGKNGPTPFCTVKGQLLTELEYISDVRAYGNNLTELWDSQQSNISLILAAVSQRVKESFHPSSNKTTISILESTFGTMLSLSGGAYPVVGVAGTLFSFGTNLANTLTGDSTSDGIGTKVGELEQQAADGFAQQKVAQGVMFDSIIEDWGKLQALGLALCDTNDPNWKWDGQITTGQILASLDRALEVSYYQSLMPVVYDVRVWNAGSSSYDSIDDFIQLRHYGSVTVFPNWPAEGYIMSPSARLDPATNKPVNDFLILSNSGDIGLFNNYTAPGEKVLQYLFDPNGLAVNKNQFYRRWPFDRRWCDSYMNSSTSNCDYNTPQVPQ